MIRRLFARRAGGLPACDARDTVIWANRHVPPQRDVLRIAAPHGLELLEVVEDPYTGMRRGEVSNTFLLRKAKGEA